VVANARAFPDPGQPQVDDARLAQAQQDADAVDDQGRRQDPDRAEQQKHLHHDAGRAERAKAADDDVRAATLVNLVAQQQ